MACAALIAQTEQPLYYPQLDHPLPPGVHNLQRWIHDAWEDGKYDNAVEQNDVEH